MEDVGFEAAACPAATGEVRSWGSGCQPVDDGVKAVAEYTDGLDGRADEVPFEGFGAPVVFVELVGLGRRCHQAGTLGGAVYI